MREKLDLPSGADKTLPKEEKEIIAGEPPSRSSRTEYASKFTLAWSVV